MGLLKEFRDFAMRGNVIDLAVGVVIGSAFGKIISSLVVMVFQNYPILNYGPFIQSVVDFLLVAGAIFLVIKALNSAKAKFDTVTTADPPPPPEDVVLLREIRDALVKR